LFVLWLQCQRLKDALTGLSSETQRDDAHKEVEALSAFYEAHYNEAAAATSLAQSRPTRHVPEAWSEVSIWRNALLSRS